MAKKIPIAYETEPPVYDDDEDDYAEVRYYDEDGNELDPSEVEWEEITDEEAEAFKKKVKAKKRERCGSTRKKR